MPVNCRPGKPCPPWHRRTWP